MSWVLGRSFLPLSLCLQLSRWVGSPGGVHETASSVVLIDGRPPGITHELLWQGVW